MMGDIVYCHECVHENLADCPLCIIEKQELIFIDRSPMFFCAKGARKSDEVFKLDRCPFCGEYNTRTTHEKIYGTNHVGIVCWTCGARTRMCTTYGDAVEVWNRRAPLEFGKQETTD